MRLLALLTVLNILGCASVCIVGCDWGAVPRPDTPLCEIIVQVEDPAAVPPLPQVLRTVCYNLKTDYDMNGTLLKTAKPIVNDYPDFKTMLVFLNKSFATPPYGWANLKAYLRNLRAANK